MKKIFLVFQLSQKLFRGQMIKLSVLLVIIFLFKIEVPLMLPLIIKSIFYTISAGDSVRLFHDITSGFIYFAINILIMFFINVKGDPWVTNFTLKAVENVFKDMSKKYIGDIENTYLKEDIFNRILSGTGSVIGLLFTSVDIAANMGAIILLTVVVYNISPSIVGFIIIVTVINFIRVMIQFQINKKYAEKIQEKKSENIKFLRFIITQTDFNHLNHTCDFILKKYSSSRNNWYELQKNRLIKNVLCDSCNSLLGGGYKLILLSDFYDRIQKSEEYVKKVASLYSLYETISARTDELGSKIGNYPNTLAPIQRLSQVMEQYEYYKNDGQKEHYLFPDIHVEAEGKVILDGISLKISKNSRIAVIGENGSGKSTFLKVIAGLCHGNENQDKIPREDIGYMPADNLLFQRRSVEQNISYCCKLFQKEQMIAELRELSLKDETFMEKKAGDLSGGEAKRVNYVRTIMRQGNIIIADEPTSSLDEKTALKVMKHLLEYTENAVIYVTHSPQIAFMADEIIILSHGHMMDYITKENFSENENLRKWANMQEFSFEEGL